jgi:hypothetical protein
MRLFQLLLVLLLVHFVLSTTCSLCDKESLLHPFDFVTSKGKTCAALMVELFHLDVVDPVCARQIAMHRKRCCHTDGDSIIVQDPPPQPPQFSLDGPFKRCDLCEGGGYPSAVGMVINMLYVGPGSCAQYYQYGQRGWIQDHLCSALQYFAKGPCGCDWIAP